MAVLTQSADRLVERTLAALECILAPIHPRDFAVRLWDGTTWGPDAGEDPRFTLVLKRPEALRRALSPPTDLNAAEAYIYDDIDIEGSVEAVAELGDRLGLGDVTAAAFTRSAAALLRLPSGGRRRENRSAHLHGRLHGRGRDDAAIGYHYDVSNDFYRLWLDQDMVYSCAYFADPRQDIDAAQRAKLDYLCRKLRLRPGERLLDIGCGWGGLVMYAARECGVDATGVTLSKAQASLARRRIADAGLRDRCRVEVLDYRDVDASAPFDKLVSVGMFEHVGEAKLPEYFRKAESLLRPGGVFLNHGISRDARSGPVRQGSFISRYVFPDGELSPISSTLDAAEKAGFEVRDVESLREHYALTLRQWVRRLEARADEARAATDDVTYRVWRLFMTLSAHGFATGSLGVYQSLLSKPDRGRAGLPLTRADWYG